MGYCEGDVGLSENTDSNANNMKSSDQVVYSDIVHIARETTVRDSDPGPSVLQMAFLQLMTQKVAVAVANCPEVLDQLNANIRADRGYDIAPSVSSSKGRYKDYLP